jgi:hypothetical protein
VFPFAAGAVPGVQTAETVQIAGILPQFAWPGNDGGWLVASLFAVSREKRCSDGWLEFEPPAIEQNVVLETSPAEAIFRGAPQIGSGRRRRARP